MIKELSVDFAVIFILNILMVIVHTILVDELHGIFYA
jgi:hypothetical protein